MDGAGPVNNRPSAPARPARSAPWSGRPQTQAEGQGRRNTWSLTDPTERSWVLGPTSQNGPRRSPRRPRSVLQARSSRAPRPTLGHWLRGVSFGSETWAGHLDSLEPLPGDQETKLERRAVRSGGAAVVFLTQRCVDRTIVHFPDFLRI